MVHAKLAKFKRKVRKGLMKNYSFCVLCVLSLRSLREI